MADRLSLLFMKRIKQLWYGPDNLESRLYKTALPMR